MCANNCPSTSLIPLLTLSTYSFLLKFFRSFVKCFTVGKVVAVEKFGKAKTFANLLQDKKMLDQIYCHFAEE